jgi:hypothetical protein
MNDSTEWPVERIIPPTIIQTRPREVRERPRIPSPAPDDNDIGLRAVATALSAPPPATAALRMTAQCVFDLRFHQLVELCTRAIEKNGDKLKVEPYDLATGLSSWAIETLAKTDP